MRDIKSEKEINQISKENEGYLLDFRSWLKANSLQEQTINKHISNVDLFINDFLCYYEQQPVSYGCTILNSYFSLWFIRKTVVSSSNIMRSHASSIKKFYRFMVEKGIIEEIDYEYLCEIIKEMMPFWLKDMQEQNSYLFD